MKKLFALILTFIFISMNNYAFATEYWQFSNSGTDEETTTYTTYAPYPNSSTYYGNVENYSTVNTPANTTTTVEQTKESFSEKHPILTGIGLGALVLGVVALGILGSDDDDRYHHNNSKCNRDRCHHRH